MKWKSKNPDWPVQEGTTEEVVDAFLEIHSWWFTTPSNSLFRQRPNVRKMIIDSIEHGTDPSQRDRFGLHAVLAKFYVEYFRDFQKIE